MLLIVTRRLSTCFAFLFFLLFGKSLTSVPAYPTIKRCHRPGYADNSHPLCSSIVCPHSFIIQLVVLLHFSFIFCFKPPENLLESL